MSAALKFHRAPAANTWADYVVRPASGENGYAASIWRAGPGMWHWESTLYGGSQDEGSAATLNEAREQIRRSYAYIAEYL